MLSKKISKYVTVLAIIILMNAYTVKAQEGTLDWFTEYHHSDFQHIGLSATFDTDSNLIQTGFIEEVGSDENDRWKVLKLSSDGNLVWDIDLMITSSSDFTCITTDSANNIYTASSMHTAEEGRITHVNKVDPDGNLVWHTTIDDMWRVQGIHYRSDGYVVVTGLGFNSNAHFKVSTLHADNEMNGLEFWATEIDSIGEFGAHHLRFSGLDSNNRLSLMGIVENLNRNEIRVGWIRILENGNVDVSGVYGDDSSSLVSFIGSASMAPDGKLYGLVSLDHNLNTKLIAIDENGSLLWNREFTQFIHLDNLGSIVFHENQPILSILNGNNTLSTYGFSDTGQFLWESTVITSLKSLNNNSVIVEEDGGLYLSGKDTSVDAPFAVMHLFPNGGGEDWTLHFGDSETAGYSYNEARFLGFHNNGLIGVSLLNATSEEDYGFVTFKIALPTSSAPESGENLLPTGLTVDTYPNPFNASLNVRVSLSSAGKVKVRLVDMLGRTVYEVRENIGSGSHVLSVNAEELTSGMYLLEATDRNGNRVAKRVTLLK